MTNRFIIFILSLLSIVACTPSSPTPVPTAIPTIAPTATPTLTPSPSYETLSERLGRSVVRIETTPRAKFSAESGTGVIISADGLVLTNAHVVAYGDIQDTLIVYLVAGTRQVARRATLLGIAPCEDLALLKISGDYTPIALNTTASIGLGTDVFLLGYGQHTLSTTYSLRFSRGNISRPNITNISPYPALIQHSAGLLSGDSGSPLFTQDGEMIGLNTMMDVQIRGAQVAFAIPSQTINVALSYLVTQAAPTENYTFPDADAELPVYRLMDYFDRHCYTTTLGAGRTLLVSAYPQETNLFKPIVSIYSPTNGLIITPAELTDQNNFTLAVRPITADGRYTVVISRQPTTTSGADKLGDYTLAIRQE